MRRHRTITTLLEIDNEYSSPSNINAVNILGQTPLHLAAKHNTESISKAMIEHKRSAANIDINYNASDNLGRNALIHAIIANSGSYSSVKYLLTHGASVNHFTFHTRSRVTNSFVLFHEISEFQ